MERGVYWYDGTWDVYFSKPLDPPPGDRVGMAAVGIKHELVYNGVPQSGMDLDDPTFGSGTDAAIRKFQQSHGLTVDGSVGPNTAKSDRVSEDAALPAVRSGVGVRSGVSV
jgi:hypothetical protein